MKIFPRQKYSDLDFILWLRFDYNTVYVASKYLYTADLLSRTLQRTSSDSQNLSQQEDIEYSIESVTSYLPASEKRLQIYRQEQAEDPTIKTVISYSQAGWPKYSTLKEDLRPFWPFRGELSLYNGLLLYGSRIVVPVKLHTRSTMAIKACNEKIGPGKKLVWLD